MKLPTEYLQLNFLPAGTNLAVLVMRIWLGLSLLLLHGMGKVQNYASLSYKFPDPLGVGGSASPALAIIGEVLCSILLVLGLLTRPSALGGVARMSVAFFLVHQMQLKGEQNGELSLIYLAGYCVLLLAGGGRWSLDALPVRGIPGKQ